MSAPLRRWLETVARRRRRRPLLEEALVTDRFVAYAVYRLRFMAWRLVWLTLLRAGELTFLWRLTAADFFAPVLLWRQAALLASAFYWGCLERLREAVRERARERRWGDARRVLLCWLAASVALAAVLLVAAVGVVVARGWASQGLTLEGAFVLATALRLALDIVTRTYHSGIYALTRVYRPLWTVVLIDLLDSVGLVLLWPWLGPWGFPATVAAAALLSTGFTLAWCRAAYARSRMPPLSLGSLAAAVRAAWQPGAARPGRRPGAVAGVSDAAAPRPAPAGRRLEGLLARMRRPLPWREAALGLSAGLSNALIQFETVFIVLLLAVAGRRPTALFLVALVYGAGPMIGTSGAWPRLFYFDFKRLHRGFGLLMQRRFERLVARAAVVIGIGLGLLGAAWSVLLLGVPLMPLHLLVVAFVLLRSMLGASQVQAFAYGQHGYVFRTATLAAAGVWLAWMVVEGPGERMLSMVGVLGMVVAGVAAPRAAGRSPSSDEPTLASLPRFFAQLGARRGSTRVGSAKLWGRPGPAMRRSVAAELQRVMADGVVAAGPADELLWFEDGTGLTERGVLIAAAGGRLARLELSPVYASGADAMRAALLAPLVSDLGPALPSTELLERFRKALPDGIALDMRTGKLRGDRISPSMARRIVRAVGRPERVRSRHDPYEICTFAPGGEPAIVFVIPRGAEGAGEWRAFVARQSLAASLIQVAPVPPSTFTQVPPSTSGGAGARAGRRASGQREC